jgi:hypothetical protein
MFAATALAAAAGAADAHTCYFLLDAKDVVVYRHVMPPVDLSERGAAEREALRRKGQLLLIMETDRCVPLGFGSGWLTSDEAPLSAAASNVGSIAAAGEGAVSRAPGIQTARPTRATPATPAAPAKQ